MGFLHRLFAPEIVDLQKQLEFANQQAQWFRERADEQGKERQAVQRKLDAEIKRNREREDELSNALRPDVRPLKARRDVADNAVDGPPSSNDPFALDESDKAALRNRAYEILEQRGGELTNANIEAQYQEMLKDPDHWLSDY